MLYLMMLLCLQGQAEPALILPDRTYRGQTIWDLPNAVEAEIDMGLWALILAKHVQPDLDIPRYLAILDEIAAVVQRGLPSDNDDMAVLMITQIVLYQPGHWNNSQVYRYDLDDPFGDRGHNRLLSTYIDTRLGNCVSMPTLYWAVLQRVDPGLELYGVEAPHHLFFRMRNRQTGAWVNMEATNGKTARDVWIQEQTGVTKAQIKAGLYMKNLSKKQVLAVLLRDIEQRAVVAGDWQEALRINALIEQVDGQAVWVRVNRAAILHKEVEAMVGAAAQAGRRLTQEEYRLAKEKSEAGEALFAWARERGWVPLDPEIRRKTASPEAKKP
ncbi:transglutaminase family protein [Acanthopleuribacter pedis]|uniref:Protein SirB1 N-terminal domain-containing protein n=1 Tax=Acanthopleuribacter pedis TaxID=442870 RepID=A0A8J7PZ07_9BACT|nr:transglutaminase family protein [Acanthopleuribacter pedis]MBO1317272.1 hypothetical protein [Acanthopleuribacter pedis]MBO1318579.1 hypothetical protein [Acanthopleuribacter pedis]